MSFNWESYIQLADELIAYQKQPSILEAYYRSAISRAYYGVFCIARNFLIKKGISIPKENTHKFVREQYTNSSNWLEKKIGTDLSRLLLDRKNADYDDQPSIDVQRAKFAVQISKEIFKNLQKLGAI
ncbi:MAG: HEPN domain-containing protein [Caldiserica bacterium]|jgi:uncharacterized protein (UPF0332 family)|nr:HEPN domain-containing protein [Caldisericota bacterium]